MGTVRVRAAGAETWAVDMMGGAGALFQHHEAMTASCPSCTDFRTETLNHTAPAYVVGGDVFVRVHGSMWAGAVVRYHVLARGSHQSEVPVLVPWQFEWKSSDRYSVGVGIRLGLGKS